jgi:site-specific DNA-methyltransferase (adenine-specific)
MNVATTNRSIDSWASLDILSQVYESKSLAESICMLELKPDFEESSSLHSDRVNTAVSRNDPVSGWVRYREGYSPELVRAILDDFPLRDGEIVLDPMCGSGSTQVAAQQMRVPSIGLDVSPYAVLVSRVKTTPIEQPALDAIEAWVLQLEAFENRKSPLPVTAEDEYLASYFEHANFEALRWIRDLIAMDWEPSPERDFLTVALLAVLEDCSNRKKDGNGLATRPSKVVSPTSVFAAQLRLMTRDLQSLTRDRSARSVSGIATAVDFESAARKYEGELSGEVGAVIFSPPYANSFDYFESYKLELLFTGLFTIDEYPSSRARLIRSYRQSGKSERVPDLPLVEALIDEVMLMVPRKEELTGVRDGRTRLVPNLLRGYFLDMREVLRCCYRCLPQGGRTHIVVDQSAYAGVPVPTDLILADIGSNIGFEFEKLTFCRRAKTSGQQLKTQPQLRGLLRETVVTLRKP